MRAGPGGTCCLLEGGPHTVQHRESPSWELEGRPATSACSEGSRESGDPHSAGPFTEASPPHMSIRVLGFPHQALTLVQQTCLAGHFTFFEVQPFGLLSLGFGNLPSAEG